MDDIETKDILDGPIEDDKEKEIEKEAIIVTGNDDEDDFSDEDFTEDTQRINVSEISNQYLMVLFNNPIDFEKINEKFVTNESDKQYLVVHQDNIIMTTFALRNKSNIFSKTDYFAATILQHIESSGAFRSLFKLIDEKYSDVKVSVIYKYDGKMINGVNFFNKFLISKLKLGTNLFKNMEEKFKPKQMEKQRYRQQYNKKPKTEQRKDFGRYTKEDERKQIPYEWQYDERPIRREDRGRENIRGSPGRRFETRSQYPRDDETRERRDRYGRKEDFVRDRTSDPGRDDRGNVRRDDRGEDRGNVRRDDRRREIGKRKTGRSQEDMENRLSKFMRD